MRHAQSHRRLADLPGVVGGTGSGDLGLMRLGPGDERLDRLEQRGAEGGEFVVDSWRHDGIDGAGDQAVALELAKRDRQHPLADAVDQALQLGEPQRPAVEQGDRQQRPLAGDAVEDLADFAVVAGIPLVRVAVGTGFADVTG